MAGNTLTSRLRIICKHFSAAVLLICLDATAAFGFQGVAAGKLPQLTAEIVGQRYCVEPAGAGVVHLDLRLRFTNAGNQKLILYKGHNLFFQVWVSPDSQRQPTAARYELKTTSARYASREPEKIERASPGKEFVVLSPRSAFATEFTVSLPVTRGDAEKAGGESIYAGEHLLRLTVSMWYESKALGEKLRERWRRIGVLWTEPISSTPIAFNSASGSNAGCR